jgi:hypothetical protein
MSKITDTPNVLLAAMRACTPEERVQFAELAGTTENYLYMLAGPHREPGVTLAAAIAAASVVMHEKTKGRVPIVTLEELAALAAEVAK